MKEKGFAPIIILLGVILVVVLAVGTYYSGRLKTLTAKFTSTSTLNNNSNVSPAPTENKNPTWKTYVNSKYGYSVKYRSDLYNNCDPNSLSLSPGCGGEGIPTIWIQVNPEERDYSQSEYPQCYTVEKSTYNLGDIQAVRYSGVENKNQPSDCRSKMDMVYSTNRGTHLIFVNSNNTYVIWLLKYGNGRDQERDQQIDEVLSSFKILDKSQLEAALKWKTYASDEGGFSLEYPPQWGYTLCNQGEKFPAAILNFDDVKDKIYCGMDSYPACRIFFKDKASIDEEIKLVEQRYSYNYSDIYLDNQKIKAKRFDLTKDSQANNRPYYAVPSTVIYIPHQPKVNPEKFDYMVIIYPLDEWFSYKQNMDQVLKSLKFF